MIHAGASRPLASRSRRPRHAPIKLQHTSARTEEAATSVIGPSRRFRRSATPKVRPVGAIPSIWLTRVNIQPPTRAKHKSCCPYLGRFLTDLAPPRAGFFLVFGCQTQRRRERGSACFTTRGIRAEASAALAAAEAKREGLGWEVHAVNSPRSNRPPREQTAA